MSSSSSLSELCPAELDRKLSAQESPNTGERRWSSSSRRWSGTSSSGVSSSEESRRRSSGDGRRDAKGDLVLGRGDLTQARVDQSGIDSCKTSNPGMRGVPEWLKSLRLHKYTNLLLSLTYEEMVELDEDKLEALGVTKGARRKIVASIVKLKERQAQLKAIDKVRTNTKDSSFFLKMAFIRNWTVVAVI